jgi:hypothetical protein
MRKNLQSYLPISSICSYRLHPIEACNSTTVKFSISDNFRLNTDTFWQLVGENQSELLAPHNMDEIYGHMLDFGF